MNKYGCFLTDLTINYRHTCAMAQWRENVFFLDREAKKYKILILFYETLTNHLHQPVISMGAESYTFSSHLT